MITFLGPADPTPEARRLYAVDLAGLDDRRRALLVTACTAAMEDSYCALAWGRRLAAVAGERVAAQVINGDDSGLAADEQILVAWARRTARNPSATSLADVARLRACGLDDRQIFAVTLFIALRVAFATVNDALGAAPDQELAQAAPALLREAVSFGRAPGELARPST